MKLIHPANRTGRVSLGLVLTLGLVAFVASSRFAFGSPREVQVGLGKGYTILGDLPVKHRVRVKPLGSVAIEELKLVHGRSIVKLLDPEGKTRTSWGSVAAILDWSARPEFWNEQDFIRVDSPELRHQLLREWARGQVRSIADTVLPEQKNSLNLVADRPELATVDLRLAARQMGEASQAGKSLDALASKLDDDREWVSPRVLEGVRLQIEGQTLTFPQWVGQILDKKGGTHPESPGPTPIEAEAIVVGERLAHFQAIRDHKSATHRPLDLQMVPRPFDVNYLKYSTDVFQKGMNSDRTLSPLEANVANTLVDYLQSLPSKEWAMPGEDAMFDQKFGLWLALDSNWLPLGIVLESNESELTSSGLPAKQVLAFREKYRDLENALRTAPGDVPEATAVALMSAARDLGTSIVDYPGPAVMARETKLTRLSPFSKAMIAYGFGLAALLLSFGISAGPRTTTGTLGTIVYGLGIAGLMAGIALELYGVFQRYRVFQRIPVTNLYETVIWASLAASMLGLAIELLWRKKYAGLAAGGIALLSTVLAENVPLLDPNILTVLPPQRINRWLMSHVLTIVSSFAVFALAMGLGLLAIGSYLTTTPGRSRSYRQLGRSLLAGIPLYGLGRLGLYLSTRPSSSPIQDVQTIYYISIGIASLGGFLTFLGVFGVMGQLANRSPRRAGLVGAILIAIASTGLIAGTSDAVQGPLKMALTSPDLWFLGLVGGASVMMSLLGAQASGAPARIEILAKYIVRTMLLGVLLLGAGALLGAAWARNSWTGPWVYDLKVMATLIVFFSYLVPLLARLVSRKTTFGVVAASVLCFSTVLFSWYVTNSIVHVGRHYYGTTQAGGEMLVVGSVLALWAMVAAAAWRHFPSQSRPMQDDEFSQQDLAQVKTEA